MNIDVTALRSLVREKDVSFDTVVEAIESALLAAYQRTEGAQPHARAHAAQHAQPMSRLNADGLRSLRLRAHAISISSMSRAARRGRSSASR